MNKVISSARQISEQRVEKVSDKLKEGDNVRVKVLEVDRQGRVHLSMRDVPRLQLRTRGQIE